MSRRSARQVQGQLASISRPRGATGARSARAPGVRPCMVARVVAWGVQLCCGGCGVAGLLRENSGRVRDQRTRITSTPAEISFASGVRGEQSCRNVPVSEGAEIWLSMKGGR